MNAGLPATGTSALLTELSDFVPDDFINQLWPAPRGQGRRRLWSSAQQFRLLLLTLLTPCHSFNLLGEMLAEQRAWRRFARLPNRQRVPAASQLHEFRERLGVNALRRINAHLLAPLLAELPAERKAVGLIDSTDLPAATSTYKKSSPAVTQHAARPSADVQSRPVRVSGS
jgi:hypothetical protein